MARICRHTCCDTPFTWCDIRIHAPFGESRENVDEFLAGVDGPTMQPIPISESVDDAPDSILKAILAGQSAIIQGVNELRANVVTANR